MIASQTEFSLSVSICAWCKPNERGAGLGAISHGICLRHLKNLKLQAQGLLPKRPRRIVSHLSAQQNSFLSLLSPGSAGVPPAS
jgi:hypothetical protein